VARRSAEGVVDPLTAGVRRSDLGGQTPQKTTQGLGSVALQAKEVLELVDYPLDDLPLAGNPLPILLGPSSAGVVFGVAAQHSIALQPVSLLLNPRESVVGQVGLVTVLDHECLRPLVRGRRGQKEGGYYAFGSTTRAGLNP
jgi:hypothetical protein